MIALLIGKKLLSSSFSKEAAIIFGVIGALFVLPVIALVSLTDVSALTTDPSLKLYTGTASTSNTYAYGYCTFWAAQRRAEIGKPIPNTWGDAHTWDDRASAMGYVVDHTPIVGSVMETDAGDLGHVAFVEKVNPDGSWEISEMNAPHWDMVNNRKLTAADAQKYKFIH